METSPCGVLNQEDPSVAPPPPQGKRGSQVTGRAHPFLPGDDVAPWEIGERGNTPTPSGLKPGQEPGCTD